jgi:hypothetical protein
MAGLRRIAIAPGTFGQVAGLSQRRKETAMRATSSIVALAALVGTVAGCAQETYYPRYGYSQAYYQPSGYSYYQPSGYSYYQPSGYYYPSGYAYRSATYDTRSDYYRNYNGIHPPSERIFP